MYKVDMPPQHAHVLKAWLPIQVSITLPNQPRLCSDDEIGSKIHVDTHLDKSVQVSHCTPLCVCDCTWQMHQPASSLTMKISLKREMKLQIILDF